MKEPMTDARRKQLYRIKNEKKKTMYKSRSYAWQYCSFLVLFAVQKTVRSASGG